MLAGARFPEKTTNRERPCKEYACRLYGAPAELQTRQRGIMSSGEHEKALLINARGDVTKLRRRNEKNFHTTP